MKRFSISTELMRPGNQPVIACFGQFEMGSLKKSGRKRDGGSPSWTRFYCLLADVCCLLSKFALFCF